MADRFPWGRSREDEPPYDRPRRESRLSEEDFAGTDFSRDYAYDPDQRAGYRVSDRYEAYDDLGQGDYDEDYAYDPVHRRGYRRSPEEMAAAERDPRYSSDRDDRLWDAPYAERRSWLDRRRGRADDDHPSRDERRRRLGPSDRVIWAVVTQRLANERGFDDRDIHVSVDNGEVTLEGLVRDRRDKRRAEDLAEMRGVSHVQNNLRVRRGRIFGF
jgi:hypothetical protein